MHTLPPQSLWQTARDSKRVHSPRRDAGLQAIPERVSLLLMMVYADVHNLINKKRGKKQEKRHSSRFYYETSKTAGAGTYVQILNRFCL
jgi:predicted RNA-binding protein